MLNKLLKCCFPVALLSSLFLFVGKEPVKAEATGNRPEYSIPVLAGEELDTANMVFDDFNDGINSDRWWINNRSWANVNGRKNGGVVPENIFYDSTEGTAIIRSTGDYYAEKEISTPKNALAEDGKRSGGDLVSKFLTYPGRYEVRMKVAPRYGVCTTMWTYIEYGGYISSIDGRHNHEIDIELPYDGNFKKVSFGNYTGGFDSMHTSEKIFVDNPLNDGEYHTYGFDWYYNDNTGNKLIRYYIDGVVLCTIDENVPFYKTKVNIGCWIPDSRLAGTPPRFDKTYADIDYFKYVPFKNNRHEDAHFTAEDEEKGKNPYNFTTGASIDQYPSQSTPNIVRNYFPNGTFDFVKKQSSSHWLDQDVTGIENSDVTIAKTTYDRSSSSNSGGACISANGYVAGYIDSCYKGQTFNLSIDYRYQGTAQVYAFNSSDASTLVDSFDFEYSSSWAHFSYDVEIDVNDTCYIMVAIRNYTSSDLWVDNITLLLGQTQEQPVDESSNHFMTIFHENPTVLSAFNTASETTSSSYTNSVLNDLDYTSAIDWKISYGRYEARNNDYIHSITMSASSYSISSDASGDNKDIYDVIAANDSLSGDQSVIYSTNAIKNIKDISLSWGSCESGNVYVLYKLENSASWNYLTSFVATAANSGSNSKTSWNRRQLVVDSSNANFANYLYGENAQIAFAYSSQSTNTDTMYIRMNSIIINKVESIKAKINYWSENNTNLCGVSGKLLNAKSLEHFDLEMVNYNLTVAQANDLNSEITITGAAKEATYYDQFVYLCNIAGITPNATPTNLVKNDFITYRSGLTLAIIIATSCMLIVGVGLLIAKRRKD